MKVHLLYPDRDFDWRWALQAAAVREANRTGRRVKSENRAPHEDLPWNEEELLTDLELNTLLTAMAAGDDCVFEVARTIILTGAGGDRDTIRFRQQILQDCLNHPAVVRELYALAEEALDQENKHYIGTLARHPDYMLRWAIGLLESLLGSIERLKKIADSHADEFVSEGWTAFFATVRSELGDEYITRIRYHLARLRFRNGVLLSAQLGTGNKGTGHVLHLPPGQEGTWLARLLKAWLPWLFAQHPPAYSFSLDSHDEAGFRMLGELANRGVGIAADALGQSADHVRNFFAILRTELAFYVGCMNVHEQLARKGEPLCLPQPVPAEKRALSFRGLYDVCLSLNVDRRVVGNDANADEKDLVIVSGANEGGKSTFLRSVGLAQLMMQSGMFVPAESFCSSVCDGLFTHYKREEDAGMKSGKLDEELGRVSDIVDHITPHPMILLNESFAATNEHEGSEIARQITSALLDRGVRMVFVTHLYEFAHGVYEGNAGRVLFLRADRQADGTRTFKLVEGEPLPTSFGEDLYDDIFGAETRQGQTGEPKVPASATAGKFSA